VVVIAWVNTFFPSLFVLSLLSDFLPTPPHCLYSSLA
jgi:hypothetical protein